MAFVYDHRARHSGYRRRRGDRGNSLSQAGHIIKPGGARKAWSLVYRDPSGCQRWEGKLRTRHEAQKRLNEVLGEIDNGTYAQALVHNV